ncbi:MAG: glycosyltransferase [Chloroflexi bacterium]|nr:glycosyltransferase [Chloroflexota bacterium]
MTLISIITPCKNRVQFVADAIDSMLSQDYPDFEHIIVDGGSTDGTLEVLARYPHLKIISGTDTGMYDAINKGLKMAKGSIIGFLNTDDTYYPNTFTKVANLFEDDRTDAVAGKAVYYRKDFNEKWSLFQFSKFLSNKIFWREVAYGEPAFNAWFFHRRVFETLTGFDTSFRIAGDREFLLRFALENFKFVPLDKVVYQYYAHDDSLSMKGQLSWFSKIADENLRLTEMYLPLLPFPARLHMQDVRTRDTITASTRNLRAGDWRKALYYAKKGFYYDKFWHVKLVLRTLAWPISKVHWRITMAIAQRKTDSQA